MASNMGLIFFINNVLALSGELKIEFRFSGKRSRFQNKVGVTVAGQEYYYSVFIKYNFKN